MAYYPGVALLSSLEYGVGKAETEDIKNAREEMELSEMYRKLRWLFICGIVRYTPTQAGICA